MNSLYQQMQQDQRQINNGRFSNDNIQSVMKMVKESGMSAKDLFFAKAKEMNVDPEVILRQLR